MHGIARAARSPTLHFALLGTLVYLIGETFWPAPESAPEPIVIRTAEIDRLHRDFVRAVGRAPTREEIDSSIAKLVDDELLFRAALARGLQHEDAVVERRLLGNQRFVTPVSERRAAPGDAARLREAYALGLERTDLVVRRRLIERMRDRILTAARARGSEETDPIEPLGTAQPSRGDPQDSALDPARVQLTHVFLSRDARGDRLERDAWAVYEKLSRSRATPEEATTREFGDPSLIPPHLPSSSQRELAARLGHEFAALAFDLPTRRWSAPIPSAYGLHVVFVDERVEPRPRSTDENQRWRQRQLHNERDRMAMRAALLELERDTVVIREPLPESLADAWSEEGSPQGAEAKATVVEGRRGRAQTEHDQPENRDGSFGLSK